MNGKKTILGILALALVFSLTLFSCNNDSGGSTGDNTEPVTLTGPVSISSWLIKVGDTVEADITGLNIKEGLIYQWQYAKAGSDVFAPITGADQKTYKVEIELGDEEYAYGWLRVVVTAPAGSTGSVTSDRVRVREEDFPEYLITGVTINPANPSVSKGGNISLNAVVTLMTANGQQNVTSDDDQYWTYIDVTWSMSGNNKPGTRIEYGTLYVAANETATTLTLKAVSLNPAVFATATVTLNAPAGKVITITGLPGSGNVSVVIKTSLDPTDWSAEETRGEGIIDNGTVTVAPYYLNEDYENVAWNKTGEYFIQLEGLNYGFDKYVYTNGADLITANLDSNPKYNIQNPVTTIEFNKFKMLQNGLGGHAVTITGLSGFNDAVVKIELVKWVDNEWGGSSNSVASGHTKISNNTATISLAELEFGQELLTGWTADDGEYFIKLSITTGFGVTDVKQYVYTNGDTLEDLEVVYWGDYWLNAPKFEFTGEASSLAFDKFKPSDDIEYSW